MAHWTILDPFNQPFSPFTEEEVTDHLVNHGDCYVLAPDGSDWELASDALNRWQLAAIKARIPKLVITMSTRDEDGQPLDMSYNSARRIDRDVNEILGLAKGLIADGHLVDSEIVALHQWFATHPDSRASWPVNVLADRVVRALEDGEIDEEERTELRAMLQQVSGERPDAQAAMAMATRLGFDDPAPTVHFRKRKFCFTGKFLFGTRKVCQGETEKRGGIFKDAVYSDVEFLVVGAFASRDWAHTSYGRKFEEAMELRTRGSPIAIVTEEHWCDALSQLRP